MAVKKGREVELHIEGLAFGGKGIARVDGLAVFVERTVPGDRVKAKVFKKRKALRKPD